MKVKTGSVKIGVLVLVLAAGTFLYQNCGGYYVNSSGRSIFSSTSSNFGAPIEPSPAVPGSATYGGVVPNGFVMALQEAEQDAKSRTQDPRRSVDALNPDRGLCIVRGGAGKYVAPVNFTTKAACESLCSQMTAYVYRTCSWKGATFVGNPPLDCVVRGGAFRVLSTLTGVTRAQCQVECDRNSAAVYRVCDWGEERLREPPRGTECRMIGGAGVDILENPVTFSSRSECQSLCDQHSSRTYRTCMYGDEILRKPSEDSKCELLGGAGKVLTPVFYGTRVDCAARCESFPQNPNRICYYGKERIR